MKKKILSLASMAIMTPILFPLVSCQKANEEEVLCTLEWDTTDGDFVYDPSIKLKEVTDSRGEPKVFTNQQWRDTTFMYYTDVKENPKILANDLMQMLLNKDYIRRWAWYHYHIDESTQLDFGSFEPVAASVEVNKIDFENYRMSFKLHTELKNVDNPNMPNSVCDLKFKNVPLACVYHGGTHPDQSSPEIPEGCMLNFTSFAMWWALEKPEWGEIADPVYPAIGVDLVEMMTEFDDYEMSIYEKYHVDTLNTLIFAADYDHDTWYRFPRAFDDDPELFAEVKYFESFFFMDFMHYFDNIKGEIIW